MASQGNNNTHHAVLAEMQLQFADCSKVWCIIDFTEVFTEWSTSFQVQAQTYSNYKKQNTNKFLTESFAQVLGCIMDKQLTWESGFLRKLHV